MFDSLFTQTKRLRFPVVVETLYREDYFVNTISSTRIALILGIVLYALFGILDLYALPISRQSAWIIRYGVVVPLFMLALAISYVQELQEYVQPATCFSAIMAGLGISYM